MLHLLHHMGLTVLGCMLAGPVAASGGLNAGLGAALPNHASYPGAGSNDLLRQGEPSAWAATFLFETSDLVSDDSVDVPQRS